MERYNVMNHLGDGTYGVVFKARHKETGEMVAIKRMKNKFKSWKDSIDLREVQNLRSLSGHPNVIELREVIREVDSSLHFVFEHMSGGNLYEYMARCIGCKKAIAKGARIPRTQDHSMSEAKIKSTASQIFEAFSFIHSKGIVHRDIKPENLLLRGDICKVADFGLARETHPSGPLAEYVSTRWYRAPEVLLRSPHYGAPFDLFAMGCIIAEMYALQPLFPGSDEVDQLCRIVHVLGAPTRDNWPQGLDLAARLNFQFRETAQQSTKESLKDLVPTASAAGQDIMNKLLALDPAARPTAKQVLHHHFFTPTQKQRLQSGFLSPQMPRTNNIAPQPVTCSPRRRIELGSCPYERDEEQVVVSSNLKSSTFFNSLRDTNAADDGWGECPPLLSSSSAEFKKHAGAKRAHRKQDEVPTLAMPRKQNAFVREFFHETT